MAAQMRIKLAVLLGAMLLLLVAGLVFLPLYNCPLCDLLKQPRSARDCVCSKNSKANLIQFLSAKRQVDKYVDDAEGQGTVDLDCYRCGKRPAPHSKRAVVNGFSGLIYLCDDCTKKEGSDPQKKALDQDRK
jgi:hypothetical protein